MMMTFEKISPPSPDRIDTPVVQIKHPTPVNVFAWAMMLPLMTLLWIAALVWLLLVA